MNYARELLFYSTHVQNKGKSTYVRVKVSNFCSKSASKKFYFLYTSYARTWFVNPCCCQMDTCTQYPLSLSIVSSPPKIRGVSFNRSILSCGLVSTRKWYIMKFFFLLLLFLNMFCENFINVYLHFHFIRNFKYSWR